MPPSRPADPAAPIGLTSNLLDGWPLPLDEDGDKSDRGTVLVIGGSAATPGAALLAGIAALRMGAGRLQIATSAPAAPGLTIAVPEAKVVGLEVDTDGTVRVARMPEVLEPLIESAQAVLVGPGMDDRVAIEAALDILGRMLCAPAVAVVDAAALHALTSVGAQTRRSLAGRLVLTPNREELDALTDGSDASGRPRAGAAAAAEFQAAVSSFGDVDAADGRRWTISSNVPGLGTSGSGDVLAGLAAGAAARCQDPAQAACWATYVHAEAGRRLGERMGAMSFIAREMLDEVPAVMRTLDTFTDTAD